MSYIEVLLLYYKISRINPFINYLATKDDEVSLLTEALAAIFIAPLSSAYVEKLQETHDLIKTKLKFMH